MDSITHIVVGAATGQLLAGKKYGRRAMIWGAIGGSLPDIDVFASNWLDRIDTFLSHRGITHSILFMILISPLLAYLAKQFYDRDLHKHKGFRLFISCFLMIIGLGVGFLINLMAYASSVFLLILSIPLTIWGGILILRIFRDYVVEEHASLDVKFKDLWLIYFVTLATHLFLDTCTTYGTGLLEPFNNGRFTLNNISVADLFFTIPALILLVIGILRYRDLLFIKLSLGWCCIYLVLTFMNGVYMNKVFTSSLESHQIHSGKKLVSPSILNNFLWYTVAEGDTAFYFGQYSLFDNTASVKDFITLPKHWELVPKNEFSYDLKTLERFSQGYYNMCLDDKNQIHWNDLRFGFMGEKKYNCDDYVFRFILKKENGIWKAHENREMKKSISEIWPVYWKRVKGI